MTQSCNCGKMEEIYHNQLNDPWNGYCINLTDQCNFRCRYCYLDERDRALNMKSMTAAQLHDVVRGIVENKKRTQTFPLLPITFYGGGEPTFDPGFFRYAVFYIRDYAAAHNLAARFSMTTNAGYETLNDFIMEHFASVGISLDGPRFLNDYQRPPYGGGSCFDRIMKNAKELYASEVFTSFFITVTSETVKHWTEIIDFFHENFPGCVLRVSPMRPFGNGKNSMVQPPDSREYCDKTYEAFLYAQGKIDLSVPDTDISDKKVFACAAASGKHLILSGDCSVSHCAHSGNIFGCGHMDADTGEISYEDSMQLTKNREINVLNYPECDSCFCKYTCAGGCPDAHIRDRSLNTCSLTRRVTRFKLEQRGKEAEGG